jgi:hypothetical protein
MHGETPDVSTREEDGLYDIRVRRESDPAGNIENGAVVVFIQHGITERRQDQLLEQRVHQSSSTAMRHQNALGIGMRIRTGDRKLIRHAEAPQNGDSGNKPHMHLRH